MGMGGMSNKEQGTLHSLRGAAGGTEREREKINEGKTRSFCIVWIAYWNKEGHVEGGTLEIPISVFVRAAERNAECEREELCMCEGVCLYVCCV